ncbi:MAG: hypothetical protein Q8P80_01875 [Candidatus Levybacteria bacterium]|nr:hypothetical protein [Candidatus Levybacteria bacterium]
MNTRAILQVPVNPTLRKEAEKEALAQGFSSLQEAVRVFLKKLAQGTIGVTFEESVQLSPQAIKRYDKILKELESGKVKTKAFSDVNSLMEHLNK